MSLGINPTLGYFLPLVTLPTTPTTTPMSHSLPKSNWSPPPVDLIVNNIDRIYAAGLFWRVVSPELFERQSLLISAIALMTKKLKAALPSDRSLQEGRPGFPGTPPSPQANRGSLITRHQRELRLYSEAITRAEKRSMLDLDPTAANIAFVCDQLTASLEFWEDARFWYGMPWWRKPRLDFPWAPSSPPSETLYHSPCGQLLLDAPSDSHRVVTFGDGEKNSSPKAPAVTRVPRCSTATQSEFSVVRAFKPKVKPISV